jgi:phospholipid/cholesterol/gamma-HCH transport system substrate-binding protein
MILFSILFLGAIFWLSGGIGDNNARYYTIYFRSYTLDGLQRDSAVTMKGVTIGSVYHYEISPKTVEEVKVVLKLENRAPIKVDTSAVIRRNLLTGLAWIELKGGKGDSPVRETAPPGEPYPIIPEGQTDIDKIAESLPAMVERLGSMGSRVNAMLSTENIENIEASLKNVRSFTQMLASNSERIAAILGKLEAATSDLSEVSATVKTFSKNTNKSLALLQEDASTTLGSLDRAINRFDSNTGKMMTSVTNTSEVLSQEMVTLSQSLSTAADTIAKTMEGFENPRSLITGPNKNALGPGEQISQ